MPATPTYPGVYVEEIPSGIRTITGVATAITAFLGRTARGRTDWPVRIQNFGDFERTFGGLWLNSTLSYSVQHFFQNGGTDAIVVRCYNGPSAVQLAAGAAPDGIASLVLDARSVAAQGTLTLTTNPVDGETMTIGGKAYTFQAALTNVDGNIAIGPDAATTRSRIVAALNLVGVAGTDYANTTTLHPTVQAALGGGDTVVLTAKTPGPGGNAITISETFGASGNTFDGATLGTRTAGFSPSQPGVAAQGTLTITNNPTDGDTMTIGAKTYTFQTALLNVDGNIAIGAGVADTRARIVAAINLTGTPGTDYAAAMTQHPTVEAANAFQGTDLVLTARSPGEAGNAIPTTETFTNAGNVFDGPTLGTTRAGDGPTSIVIAAADPGGWANNLRITIDHAVGNPADVRAFNLTVDEVDPGQPAVSLRNEKFFNLSVDPASPLHVDRVLASRSAMVRIRTSSQDPPGATSRTPLAGGSDGQPIGDAAIVGPGFQSAKRGLWALENADLFNILCIPPLTFADDVGAGTRDAAKGYCKDRRAFFIVDPPSGWASVADAEAGLDALNLRGENAALYFPRVRMVDPLRDNQLSTFAPSGVVAGVYARTDAQRGVWKAPAGTDATMIGVRQVDVPLTDPENGRLNVLGIDCLRTFPVIGPVVWGARTREGADQLASEWKYVPVRRTALFIEETLYRNLKWVVFEPNDEPLWSQIRLNVGSFMHTLFRQGAFQGASPKEAYLVRCDKETTTQADIDRGIVNILVGFAPLKPAEFVFVRIHQLAGQLAT